MNNNNNGNICQHQTSFFNDGAPVPDLLTEQEAIRFLRLDGDDANEKNAVAMLDKLMEEETSRA